MDAEQHTPGPWEYNGRVIFTTIEHPEDSSRVAFETIAKIEQVGNEADIPLLTAGPDLLESLEYAEKELTGIYNLCKNVNSNIEISIGQFQRLESIRQAITKAKGEQ